VSPASASARAHVEAVLRAVGDENLRRVAAHAARNAQVFRHGLPQRHVAFDRAVAHLPRTDAAPPALHAAAPLRERELIQRGRTGQEGQQVVHAAARAFEVFHSARELGRGFGRWRGRLLQANARHHRALPSAEHQALRGELLVGVEH
jgi:hypothetical protein